MTGNFRAPLFLNRCSRQYATCIAVFFLACVFPFSTAGAATLHLIIVTDTDDPQIGDDVKIDRGRLVSCFKLNVAPQQLNLQVLSGEAVSVNNVVAAIRGLSVQADDAIVFAYAGHGLYDQTVVDGQPRGHALQFFHSGPQPSVSNLAVAESSVSVTLDTSKLLYRSQLIDELGRKGARLVVNWTDCCTTFVEIKNQPLAAQSMAEPEDVILSPLFRQLFFTHGGLIDLCGSAPGEMAWGDGVAGGYATRAFCRFLEDNSQMPLAWTDAYFALKERLAVDFQTKYPGGADRSSFGLPNQQTQTLHRFAWSIPSRLGLSVVNDPAGRGVAVVEVGGDENNPVPARKVNTILNGKAVIGRMSIGDIITNINTVPIRTEQEFVRELEKSGRQMSFSILNKDDNFTPLDCSVELAF